LTGQIYQNSYDLTTKRLSNGREGASAISIVFCGKHLKNGALPQQSELCLVH